MYSVWSSNAKKQFFTGIRSGSFAVNSLQAWHGDAQLPEVSYVIPPRDIDEHQGNALQREVHFRFRDKQWSHQTIHSIILSVLHKHPPLYPQLHAQTLSGLLCANPNRGNRSSFGKMHNCTLRITCENGLLYLLIRCVNDFHVNNSSHLLLCGRQKWCGRSDNRMVVLYSTYRPELCCSD